MKNYIKLIRTKHWLKNLIIFFPLFFSVNLFKTDMLINCILSFFIFSFTASIVYIINDISDIENDKKHPLKKKRILASGLVSKRNAYITMLILLVLTIILMTILFSVNSNIFIFIVPLVYLIINILYSKGLKNIPIVDVSIIVCGFVLRVIYGGVATNIVVSKYLYLMIIFGAFYLGFGKRRNEIIKNGNKSRKVLETYNKNFLDKNMYVAYVLAIVSYTLWCIAPETIARIGNDYVFWTIPILIIILQLYSLNIEADSDGDPIEVILSDKKILTASIIYVITMITIIYII